MVWTQAYSTLGNGKSRVCSTPNRITGIARSFRGTCPLLRRTGADRHLQTGGLDTRMIMAWPARARFTPCYTFGGTFRDSTWWSRARSRACTVPSGDYGRR